ncbi:hypothetical protein [Anaeromyxobacter oryzae]|uniref:Uncharacterized protein n=1 Tax=Anaeromyxobacter oryzae TaxID=2918170 RepID=A0ABN6MQH1_9BACT|nr:hypothetical protein [Anaeromyxobacter oryzae]BDG03185.1 hypothetical protein AMOR_21810 [Anaeromyxobacter oryzae]
MPRGLTSPLLLAGVALGIAMALGGAGAIRAIHRTEALVLGASLAAGLAVFAREARRLARAAGLGA